ncbi:MAG: hypothetical protein IPH07_24240 [Deltaproteobacteria bacterium]|nr:hypothetical protein [Deltaproteobacteria bacterium]
MVHAIDTETTPFTGDQPVPRLVCVSVAGPSGCGVYHVDDPVAREMLRYVLATGAVFANAPFDVSVIWRQWPDLLPEIWAAYDGDRICDVLVREKLIDIAEGFHFQRGGYSLRDVSRRRAGVELEKGEDTWRLHYGELLPYPVHAWPEDARRYALDDAVGTLATYHAQHAYAGFLDDQYRQSRGHLALYLQSLRGIDTDQDQVARVDSRLRGEILHHTGVCLAHGLARVGGTRKEPTIVRTKAAAAAMLEQHCARTNQRVPRTDKGAVSLDEEALVSLSIPDSHPLASYRMLGSLGTQHTGWVGPLSHPIVRTKYDELKETGRTGSSGFGSKARPHPWTPSSRNLQNFPQEGGYRECLVPPPGSRFVVSDFKGAELVTLAQCQLDWFGRSPMADAIARGRDPHAEFAATLLHIPPELFDPTSKVHKEARKLAKAWNFGKPGGMGSFRFITWARTAYGVEVTPYEERENTRLWLAQWEMKPFFDRTSALERGGFIEIKLPRSNRVRGRCFFPDACNTQFQGPASDAAKEALYWLLRAQYDPTSPMFGGHAAMRDPSLRPSVYQCLFVHDENVTVAPAERAQSVLAEQRRIMIAAFANWCPQVPIQTEDHIIERYAKV